MELKDYINNAITESVNRQKEEDLKESLRPMILEAFQESFKKENNHTGKIKISALVDKLMKNPEFKKKAMEYLTDKDAYDGWSDNIGKNKYTSLDNLSDGAKRRIVTQRLKDRKIDYAPIAYELWPNMSEDAARSWFSKKVDGKKVSFTDEEVSKIFMLLNNTLK